MPLHVSMAIMHQESKFRKKAKPRRRWLFGFIPWKRPSSAYGYAQALDGTWQAYIKDTGRRLARRTSFDDSMDFIGWYLTKASHAAGIELDDTYRQYLAYHEGWTGYKNRSYKNKAWLQRVAGEVDALSGRYAAQYHSCKNDLNKGFLKSLF